MSDVNFFECVFHLVTQVVFESVLYLGILGSETGRRLHTVHDSLLNGVCTVNQFRMYYLRSGAWGSVVVKALRY